MKRLNRIVACLGMMVGVGVLAAAALQPKSASSLSAERGMPCVSVQVVETDSPKSYAMWIGEVNKAIKEKFKIETHTRVFVGEAAGPDSGVVFAVSRADSFSTMAANAAAFEKEVALVDARLQLNKIRKLGPQVMYKAVRWDGANPDAAVMNTRVVLSDEAGYLQALDGFRGLLDSHDFTDVKINCYRVAAGRTDFTHLVSLNCPSRERRAALMDATSSEAWAQEWIASAGKYRTVVANGTYREITPSGD